MSSRLLPSSFLILTLFARTVCAQTLQPTQASGIAEIVQKAMKTEHLRAVIVEVTQGDKVIISQQGNYRNSSDTLFRLIGKFLAPDDAPPTAKN